MTREELEKIVHEFTIKIYHEGFEDGSADVKTRVESAYEKGLEDAWECARKIILSCGEGGFDAGTIEDIFGMSYHDVLKECKPNKAIELIKEYEERQKDDEKSCGTCKHLMRISCGAYPCTDCPRDTLPKWEPNQTDATDMNDGNIKVGDEVRIKGSDPVKDNCDYGVCTRSLPNVNTIYVMRRDGSSGEENKDEWYRTGRFFSQVAEVLKLLRGEE